MVGSPSVLSSIILFWLLVVLVAVSLLPCSVGSPVCQVGTNQSLGCRVFIWCDGPTACTKTLKGRCPPRRAWPQHHPSFETHGHSQGTPCTLVERRKLVLPCYSRLPRMPVSRHKARTSWPRRMRTSALRSWDCPERTSCTSLRSTPI